MKQLKCFVFLQLLLFTVSFIAHKSLLFLTVVIFQFLSIQWISFHLFRYVLPSVRHGDCLALL